jgi:hypothetical protein
MILLGTSVGVLMGEWNDSAVRIVSERGDNSDYVVLGQGELRLVFCYAGCRVFASG